MPHNAIAIIGSGHMASAIVHGLVEHGFTKKNITVTNPQESQLAYFLSLGLAVDTNNARAAAGADVIVLAVKPNHIATVCEDIISSVGHCPLIISIAAGVSLNTLKKYLGGYERLARVMPNMAAAYGQSATSLYIDNKHSNDSALVETVFMAIGPCFWVKSEAEINITTAIAGSGPAYFLFLLESMQAAAVELGLAGELSKAILCQTVKSVAALLEHSESDFLQLREKITSKGGTTAAAMDVFEKNSIDGIITQAIIAANNRAIFLDNEK